MNILLIMSTPLIMAFISFLVFFVLESKKSRKRTGKKLLNKSIKYAIIGAGLTLILTISHMVWYEKTTGYSAGNDPLGWLFFYGPISAALGQLIALIKWQYEKTHNK